jgi:peptide/nickel transport system permease protein
MLRYVLRKIGYGVLILLGVNLITFVLFFAVNTPDDMARLQLGGKRVTAEAIENWKAVRGYDKPLFWNGAQEAQKKVTDTIFWNNTRRMLTGDFGASDAGRDIASEIRTRMWPSLALALPTFLLGVMVIVFFSLLLVYLRRTKWETGGIVLAVVMMSVSSLFYIIFGQWAFAKVMKIFPISGFSEGFAMVSFLALPVVVGVISRIGGDSLLYRSMFLEELNKDYVRTARAKGLSEERVLLTHVLRNASLPILTSTIAVIPLLFMGSLVMESFFGIPGLGSFTIDAINAQDFAIVRTMVFVGTVLYIFGLILTDLTYALVDPRIRLK